MPRLFPALVAAPVALTLAACCGGFELDEPTSQTLSALGADPAALEVDYDCGLEGGVVPQLDRACLLLSEEAKFLVELDGRYAKALTEGEKGKLGELRDEVLARLQSDSRQLQDAIAQLEQPRTGLRLAVVLAMDEISVIKDGRPADVAEIDSDDHAALRSSSVNARFHRVRVVSDDQRPLGVLLREVSPAQALAMLVADMKSYAVAEGFLSPETQAALE